MAGPSDPCPSLMFIALLEQAPPLALFEPWSAFVFVASWVGLQVMTHRASTGYWGCHMESSVRSRPAVHVVHLQSSVRAPNLVAPRATCDSWRSWLRTEQAGLTSNSETTRNSEEVREGRNNHPAQNSRLEPCRRGSDQPMRRCETLLSQRLPGRAAKSPVVPRGISVW